MAWLYVPVWKVFAAFWPGRRTKFLSRRTTAKKKKRRKTLNTRTPENPEFSSLESCVNFVETSRGFWLLINRLDKLFSKRFRNMFCHYSSSPSGILTLLPRSLWSLVLPRSELESITSWWFSSSFDPYCSLFLLSQFYLFSSLQTAKQSGFFFSKSVFQKYWLFRSLRVHPWRFDLAWSDSQTF